MDGFTFDPILPFRLGVIMEKKNIMIDGAYITLGQLLKEETLISSGGMAKWYLSEHQVHVNGEFEDRRGKKLYPGDQVTFIDEALCINIDKNGDDHES